MMEEWKEYRLDEVCKSIADGDHMPPPKVKRGIPFVTISNIKDNRLDLSDTYFVPQEYYDALDSKRKPQMGDTIYSVVGTFGKPVYIKDNNPFVFQRHIAILRPDASFLNPLFLYYTLLSPQFYTKADIMAIGAVQRTISLTSLRNATIQIPSLTVQEEIVSILKTLDDKIEVNRRINENLEQQAQALFKSWFVDFEPFKDQPFVESELGMIPQGWRVGILSEIAEIIMGTSPSGSSYNTEGKGDVFYQGRAEFGFRFPDRNLYTTEAKRFADVDTVLVSVRAPVGDINVAEEKCCIGRGLASVRSNKGINSFILYLMQSLKPVFDRFNGEGTVFGSINKKAFEDLKVVIPDEKSVFEFDSISSRIDSKIKRTVQESRRLAELRDTLLSRLMSGVVDVNKVCI